MFRHTCQQKLRVAAVIEQAYSSTQTGHGFKESQSLLIAATLRKGWNSAEELQAVNVVEV